jgi:transposase
MKREAFRLRRDRQAAEVVRAVGLSRSRYIGKAKTYLQHLATADAINLERVADWLVRVARERTRRSSFARVMQPLPTVAL